MDEQSIKRGHLGQGRLGELGLFAILCIGSGLLLILENYEFLSDICLFWPIFPMAIGAGFTLLFFKRYRHDVKLLGIGVYLFGVSLFFFVCNFTTWRIVARAWPVFIFLLGLSVASVIPFVARRVLHATVAFFLVSLSVVFFIVFAWDARLWPISLVFFGICILLFKRSR